MPKATTVISKKRRGPEPTGKGTPVLVRLQPDLLAKVDAIAEKTDEKRPAVIRAILEGVLSKE